MTSLNQKEQLLLGRLIDNFLKLPLDEQQYILGRTEEKAEQAIIRQEKEKQKIAESFILGDKNKCKYERLTVGYW